MTKPFDINPLHPEILRSYRGTPSAPRPDGSVELRFPTMGHATAWAATCEVEDRVSIPGFMAGSFADPVSVVLAALPPVVRDQVWTPEAGWTALPAVDYRSVSGA